jgi:hypothetical protein
MDEWGSRHRNAQRSNAFYEGAMRFCRGALSPVSARADAAPIGSRVQEGHCAMPRTNNTNRHADCLTVLCPTTHSLIKTTIATDVGTLAKAWHRKIRVSCPHCGKVHKYRVCEAFVQAAISNAHLRGELTLVSYSNPLLPHPSPRGPRGSELKPVG